MYNRRSLFLMILVAGLAVWPAQGMKRRRVDSGSKEQFKLLLLSGIGGFLQENILSWFDQKDLLNARLVCKFFNDGFVQISLRFRPVKVEIDSEKRSPFSVKEVLKKTRFGICFVIDLDKLRGLFCSICEACRGEENLDREKTSQLITEQISILGDENLKKRIKDIRFIRFGIGYSELDEINYCEKVLADFVIEKSKNLSLYRLDCILCTQNFIEAFLGNLSNKSRLKVLKCNNVTLRERDSLELLKTILSHFSCLEKLEIEVRTHELGDKSILLGQKLANLKKLVICDQSSICLPKNITNAFWESLFRGVIGSNLKKLEVVFFEDDEFLKTVCEKHKRLKCLIIVGLRSRKMEHLSCLNKLTNLREVRIYFDKDGAVSAPEIKKIKEANEKLLVFEIVGLETTNVAIDSSPSDQ